MHGVWLLDFGRIQRHDLVVPGFLDSNKIFDGVNKQLQSLGVNLWVAYRIRRFLHTLFDDLAFLERSDANSEERAKCIEGAFPYFERDLVNKAYSPSPCHFEKALANIIWQTNLKRFTSSLCSRIMSWQLRQ